MKKIELKTLGKEGKLGYLVYEEVIKNIVRVPSGREGLDLKQIRQALRIFDALDAKQGNELSLEDADYEFLKQRVNIHRWGYADRSIVQFVDDINSV